MTQGQHQLADGPWPSPLSLPVMKPLALMTSRRIGVPGVSILFTIGALSRGGLFVAPTTG
ncbi:hypothetical protein [Yersinia massiliensis]|uniref:hypothetical protein n=1 Tax=Yersinia massiliensis TaxID=419257 RepID=UPI0011A461B4|nr:hypothetical protein [Yersinia massiliensis]